MLLVALLLVWLAPAAWGQERDDEAAAIEAGREALADVARFPWYDRSQDDVRRLEIRASADADSANRGSKWTKDDSAPTRGGRGGRRFTAVGAVLQWLGITFLILLLGLIAFLIAKAFLKEEVSETVVLRKVIETRHDVDRVEALPFQVRGAAGDLLGQARRLYEAGEFSEAIIYLFSFQLVQLDKHHLIRLAKGKTNRQYLREVRQRPAVRSILELTMYAFEDVFFGGKTLSRERFEECWRRMDEFHQELERTARAAA